MYDFEHLPQSVEVARVLSLGQHMYEVRGVNCFAHFESVYWKRVQDWLLRHGYHIVTPRAYGQGKRLKEYFSGCGTYKRKGLEPYLDTERIFFRGIWEKEEMQKIVEQFRPQKRWQLSHFLGQGGWVYLAHYEGPGGFLTEFSFEAFLGELVEREG